MRFYWDEAGVEGEGRPSVPLDSCQAPSGLRLSLWGSVFSLAAPQSRDTCPLAPKYCRNLVRLANGVPSDGWHGAGSLGANMTARAVARVLWMFGREESLRFLSGVTILSGPLHKAPYVCLRPCGGSPMYRSCVFNRCWV